MCKASSWFGKSAIYFLQKYSLYLCKIRLDILLNSKSHLQCVTVQVCSKATFQLLYVFNLAVNEHIHPLLSEINIWYKHDVMLVLAPDTIYKFVAETFSQREAST